MKSLKKLIVVFVFLFSTFVVSQNEKIPSYFSNELQSNNTQLISGGTNNSFNTRLEERISTISLKQIGNENIANIDDKLAQGEHKVYQIGNNNNYQFLNHRSSTQINLGVLQTGDANSLKVVGINSMFKNLKIAQFGGAKMSIINY